MKKIGFLVAISLFSGATTLGAYKLFFEGQSSSGLALSPNYYTKNVGLSNQAVDFTEAAEQTVHSVVHVKNVMISKTDPMQQQLLEFFYGYRGSAQPQMQVGTGSGVIISEDGYIVTNNHVVEGASELEVTLNNNKTYKAKLIGTDSKMDIALLKAETTDKLPYTVFGNSDNLKVGEWVLAVGNPYNLTSTVTAGIVSAKSRSVDQNSIQSFIQTDAAVNPGNSGGALVNTRGELMGINTMISSNTGSYVGYSFAIPSNIAKKIIEDLMQFGSIQRGVLGVSGTDLNSMVSDKLKLKETQGFYISKVSKGTGAAKAGLQEGDIIVKLDENDIKSYADLSSYINSKRPNDVVKVTFLRDDKTETTDVTLSKKEMVNVEFNGLELEDIDAADKKKFRVNYGVKIANVTAENLMPYADDLKGSIILSIDNQKVTDMETASRILATKAENQRAQYELLMTNGKIVRIIL